MSEYLNSLSLGEDVLYRLSGQVYQEKVERTSADFLWVDGMRFNRRTGTENPVNEEDLTLDQCAVLLCPSPEATSTFLSHKKRRMTSSHVKDLVDTGIMRDLDDNCVDFLRRCYVIFDAKLAAEQDRRAATERDIEDLSVQELSAFVEWGIEKDMLEECSAAHAEFVKKVLDEKAAIKYVYIISQKQERTKAGHCSH